METLEELKRQRKELIRILDLTIKVLNSIEERKSEAVDIVKTLDESGHDTKEITKDIYSQLIKLKQQIDDSSNK